MYPERSQLARLTPGCDPPAERASPDSRVDVDPANQTVVRPGVYDDFGFIHLVPRRLGARTRAFDGPYGHTISYSDTPGLRFSIAFRGTALTYVFTGAQSRLASVTIDGTLRTLSICIGRCYWQARHAFCCFSAREAPRSGPVTGQSSPKSSGRFVDVDSFVVH